MPSYGQSVTLQFVAWDTTGNVGKTGDAANFILRWVKDGTSAVPTNIPATEVDSTNAPGLYKIVLTAAEASCQVGTICGKSSTAGVAILPLTVTFENLPTAALNATGGLAIVGSAPLSNLDVAISSRLSTAGYVAPPSAASIASSVLTTQMIESYNTDGVVPTLTQAALVIMQRLTDFTTAGPAITVRKIDGATTAYGLTLDSATTPAGVTRSS